MMSVLTRYVLCYKSGMNIVGVTNHFLIDPYLGQG